MSFPHAWARLPGPADLLAAIVGDLSDRNSVFVGLPTDVSGALFAVEVADLVKRDRCGRWESVRSVEAHTAAPSDSVTRRLSGQAAGECILWVDATGSDNAAAAWADFARLSAGSPEAPRLCIGMAAARAAECAEDKGLRRRVWQDFVTASDSRVLAERSGRRRGNSPLHTALKSALIAELAGTDLASADRLSREPLRWMVDAKEHPDERIWAAQVSVLFPVVERERRRLLDAYRTLWHLPHIRKDETEVSILEELQIGDMAYQALDIRVLAGERQRLNWLQRVRNALAHGEPVAWGTLVSLAAQQVADFRE